MPFMEGGREPMKPKGGIAPPPQGDCQAAKQVPGGGSRV